MPSDKCIYRSPIVTLKVVTVFLGFFLTAVSIHSHFDSGWLNHRVSSERAAYEICDVHHSQDLSCPDISLERFFISVVPISLILSLIGLIFIYPRTIDSILHGIMSLLLLIGSVLYIVSAEQIANLVLAGEGRFIPAGVDMRRGEKITAAVFGIIQATLYCVLAFMILLRWDYHFYEQGNASNNNNAAAVSTFDLCEDS